MINKMTDLVMYIIVNSELNLNRGKCAAQSAHIACIITDELVRSGLEAIMNGENPSDAYLKYIKWFNSCTKIILKTSEDDLRKLILENPKKCRFFKDQIYENDDRTYLTAIGFFPDVRNELFDSYSLA